MTTKQKGDINELRCMTKFVEFGFTVAKPISEDSKYDFVIEKEGKFLRNSNIAIVEKSSCPEWTRERIPNPSGEIPLQVRLLSATPFQNVA